MLKYIFTLLILFVSFSSLGSGKLSLQPTFWETDKGYVATTTFGLSVYEKVIDKNIYLNHWMGTGVVPNAVKGEIPWLSSNTDLDFVFGHKYDFTVSPGVQFTKGLHETDWLKNYHVKLSIKLW